MTRKLGVVVLMLASGVLLIGPAMLGLQPDDRHASLLNAPPTTIHVRDENGNLVRPYICKWRLIDQLQQVYEEDRAVRSPLVWLSAGRIVTSSQPADVPLLLLGTDSYGRDVLARLFFGARLSLSVALVSALGAALLGTLIGGAAGYFGGVIDEVLSRISDFVLVLPAMYIALALRAALPLVLTQSAAFFALASIFVLVGAPPVARTVRALIQGERKKDYAVAALSLGASHRRLLLQHLLPAASGAIAVQFGLLIPAFIVAEATLSYIGLGFPDTSASWGTMLHEAIATRAIADFPWLLSPIAAIFLVVFAVNLVIDRADGRNNFQYQRQM
jgi:peptide/nickel transport system permease protein